ncbi:MAG: M28 family peptidase, partial [Clostridiales bacterium]|nr:M28 family peptidase [Clostridiales bacterium]
MKKRFGILSVILCVVIIALCLVSCSDYGAPAHTAENPNYVITPAQTEAEYAKFMTEERIDRTTFNQGEKDAAQYLVNRLLEMGYDDVVLQDFTTSENEVTDLKSQNVIARVGSKSKTAKNVIIGAYYDNRNKVAYKGATSDGGEGAVSATSVAAVLSVADYIVNHQSSIDSQLRVTIVFFGASYVSNDGAKAFLDKMDDAEYRNTVLMVEMQRLCGDYVYAFSDARETKREKLFDKVAADNGLNIYKPTS